MGDAISFHCVQQGMAASYSSRGQLLTWVWLNHIARRVYDMKTRLFGVFSYWNKLPLSVKMHGFMNYRYVHYEYQSVFSDLFAVTIVMV